MKISFYIGACDYCLQGKKLRKVKLPYYNNNNNQNRQKTFIQQCAVIGMFLVLRSCDVLSYLFPLLKNTLKFEVNKNTGEEKRTLRELYKYGKRHNGRSSNLSYSLKLAELTLYRRHCYFSVKNTIATVIEVFNVFMLYHFLGVLFKMYCIA